MAEGEFVNIEVQGRNNDLSYANRVEYHVAHLLNHYTPKGTDWVKIPKVYQISVVNFIFCKDDNECFHHFEMATEDNDKLAGIMNVIFLELPKVRNLPDDISKLTEPELWGKFFLYAQEAEKKDFIMQLCSANRGIDMAVKVLENVSQDELNWYHETRYWMHVSDEKTARNAAIREGREKGLAEGREKGLTEGKSIANLENAKKMLALGMDYDTIQSVTGVSKEQFENE